MSARKTGLLVLALLAVALLLGRALSSAYADYRWFASMGALDVWRVRFATISALRLVSGLLATAFIFMNLFAVRRTVVSLRLPRRLGNIEIAEEVPGRYLLAAVLALSLAFGALVTVPADSWTSLTLARSGVPFGESDPHFQTDLGFFVYWLPFERELYYWSLVTALLVTVLVIFLYALTPSLRWERGTLYVSNYVRRHLIVLCAVLLVVLAWSYRLDAYKVLLLGSGPEGTLTWADHRARIPINLALSVLTVGAGLVVVAFGWSGQVRVAVVGVLTLLLLGAMLRHVAPVMVQRFAVPTDPAERERAYQTTRVLYTRRAYALERLRPGEGSLAFRTLREAAIGVSIWDPLALDRWMSRARESEGATQAIGFAAGEGGIVASVVKRPDPPPAGVAPASRWTLARVLASVADARGNPLRVSEDGRADDEEQLLATPLVYAGAGGYTIVPDSSGRVPAPLLASAGARLAHAWSLQNFRLLFGDLPQPAPRIVARRDVRERLRALVPFFMQGSGPAPVIHADTVYWVTDLYAASGSYPLSERVAFGRDEFSYVQHAATAIVNGRTGRVTIVADSALDPIARSWQRVFPRLFVTWEDVPAALAALVPPVIDGAQLQAAVFARHGRRSEAPRRGQVPTLDGTDSLLAGGRPALFAPQTGDGIVASSIPYLDQSGNVRGVVLATGGPRRATYWIEPPADAGRWRSVLDRLRRFEDTTLSVPREAVLVRGRVQAIPVGDAIVFAQSSYAWRGDDPPTLLRVTALHGDSLSWGRSLAEALRVNGPATPAGKVPIDDDDFRARVERLYERMRDALRRADWPAFGDAYEALGDLLARPPR